MSRKIKTESVGGYDAETDTVRVSRFFVEPGRLRAVRRRRVAVDALTREQLLSITTNDAYEYERPAIERLKDSALRRLLRRQNR